MSKKSLKITFLWNLPCKKRVFFQGNFKFLQNVLERWYGHGRKCVKLLRSRIFLFWNRTPIGTFARAPARSKFGEMLKNAWKSSKNRFFQKKKLNKRPWKFFKCFGHVFRSFVTCKVFWSDSIRSLQNTLQVKISGKHAQNIWRTSRDVYSIFSFLFVFEKIDFFSIFYDFRAFFEHFTKFWAHGRARKCSNRRAIFKITKFRISEV